MIWLQRFFTWWQGGTWNTFLWSWRNGELVGHDEFGNAYYRTKGGKIHPDLGFERRWVMYKGESEASATPTGWFGWLHHIVDTPPTEENYKPYEWQLPYQANQTGTPNAWRPEGSLFRRGQRPPATGDYEAWTPKN